MKPPYTEVIAQLNVLSILTHYQPTLIGTPPLQIHIESSDIDIACSAADLHKFILDVTEHFGAHVNFISEHFIVNDIPAARCSFNYQLWEVELFCQTIPINEQWGVRHFNIEKRLLTLKPDIKTPIIELKKKGLKTEPAFAKLLGLAGDPFKAMLELEALSDDELLTLISYQI